MTIARYVLGGIALAGLVVCLLVLWVAARVFGLDVTDERLDSQYIPSCIVAACVTAAASCVDPLVLGLGVFGASAAGYLVGAGVFSAVSWGRVWHFKS